WWISLSLATLGNRSAGLLSSLNEKTIAWPSPEALMTEQADSVRTVAEGPAKSLVAQQCDPVASLPSHIGRYRVERLLGKGGFGLVYLARDEQLARAVAVKVPHPHLLGEAEAYLAEARTVANLDHPNIVPVYDVGGTEHFPCYVVSKF